MMMRGLAGGSVVPVPDYPTVQSRKLISGLNVYGWVADFPCVRFGFVMRQGEFLNVVIVRCHWHPVLPVELRVRGI
jgi:hypothetical protein